MMSPRKQRGAMGIMLALMLLGLITMLGLVEVGYLYWAHRDVQKVADLAALSGAQRLDTCVSPNGSNTAAIDNAKSDNHFTGNVVANCGYWSPSDMSAPTYFGNADDQHPANAASVTASLPLTPFFGFAKFSGVSAKAIAAGTGEPIAAFSVGSTLIATKQGSTLGKLLNSIGIPVDETGGTSLVGYNGLADVSITPAGLLKQLGIPVASNITVAGLNQLLAAHEVSLGNLLDAIVTVAGQEKFLDTNAELLDTILAELNMTNMPDVKLGGLDGLFAEIVAPDHAAQSALDASVNVLKLLATAIGVGTGKHAIVLDPNLKIGGLLDVSATTEVIEPPSIAIGGVGTTAHTAQIRTYLHIKLDTEGAPLLGSLLGSILGTQIKLDLPVAIDVVDATATLTSLCNQTDEQGHDLATFHVDSPILQMCVGNITPENAFSKVGSCDQLSGADEDYPLLSASVAGANLLSLNTHFHTNALPADGDGSLYAGQAKTIPEDGNPIQIGTTIDNLFAALTTALVANPSAQYPSQANPDELANKLWDSTDTSESGIARATDAINQVDASASGLQGLLGNTVGQVTDILGETLTLNIPGLLGGVGGLLDSVTRALANIVNGLSCTLGSKHSCINLISGSIQNTNDSTYSGALLSVLGLLVQTLEGPLNEVGSTVLKPLITDTLGLQLGTTDVHLQSLQCHPHVHLVY